MNDAASMSKIAICNGFERAAGLRSNKGSDWECPQDTIKGFDIPVSAARPLSRCKLTVVALDEYGGNRSRLEIGYHGIAAPSRVLGPIAGRSLADHVAAMRRYWNDL